MSEPGVWLTPEEVEQLTARKRWSAQCRKLAEIGVQFRANAVGRPLVERSTVIKAAPRKRSPSEPNWDALHGKVA